MHALTDPLTGVSQAASGLKERLSLGGLSPGLNQLLALCF